MDTHRLSFLAFSLGAIAPVSAAMAEDEDRKSEAPASCSCPLEGEWRAQNLEGWMNCTGPVNIKRKLTPVKDEGTIWILKESCASLFGEASKKSDEDVLMEREDSCGYKGVINGAENGVNMVIDVAWTIENVEFITGEMHSKPSLQGMMCEYYRPFELRFDKRIAEDDYEKRKKTMQKKLDDVLKARDD